MCDTIHVSNGIEYNLRSTLNTLVTKPEQNSSGLVLKNVHSAGAG